MRDASVCKRVGGHAHEELVGKRIHRVLVDTFLQ
jgi:hypothetical protein